MAMQMMRLVHDTRGAPENIKHNFRDKGGMPASVARLCKLLGDNQQTRVAVRFLGLVWL